MDVRSADSASLAAKRLELNRTQPVAKRPKGMAEDRVAADVAVEEEFQRDQEKAPGNADGERVESPEEPEKSAATSGVASPTEEHILDVRV